MEPGLHFESVKCEPTKPKPDAEHSEKQIPGQEFQTIFSSLILEPDLDIVPPVPSGIHDPTAECIPDDQTFQHPK